MSPSRKRAFVMMPFANPIGEYYSTIYKPALERAGYEPQRADDFFAPRPILEDIRKSILDADLLLADLTGRNPNVFYELGLAHAIGKPAILLAQEFTDVPFDLQHVRIVIYDRTRARWSDELQERIISAATEVEARADGWPLALRKPVSSNHGNFSDGITAAMRQSRGHSLDIYALSSQTFLHHIAYQANTFKSVRVLLPTKSAVSSFLERHKVHLSIDASVASNTIQTQLDEAEQMWNGLRQNGRIDQLHIASLETFPTQYVAILDRYLVFYGKYFFDGLPTHHGISLADTNTIDGDERMAQHFVRWFDSAWRIAQ